MINKKFTVIIAFFSLLINTGFSQEKVLAFGGKEGWPTLSKMDGVTFGKGRFGYEAVELNTNGRYVDNGTDLLIDFEQDGFADTAKNYTVTKNSIVSSKKSQMGKYSGLVRGTGGIRLKGNGKSLFGKSGVTGSFLIEFWLNPSIAENGEVVFSWRSSRTVESYPLYQMISAGFQNNHLMWTFTNVFDGYIDHNGVVSLQSESTIIPDSWTHHSIVFDQETGMLEYRINGRLEALEFVTTNRMENGGSIYMPYLGVPADIEICPNYTGLVDDFRIQRTHKNETAAEMRYDIYKNEGGRFETQPVLFERGANLTSIDFVVTEPEQTDVVVYYRCGENYFNWTDDFPEWKPVENGQKFMGVTGKYYQLAADLYPDGSGKRTPQVTEINLRYTEVTEPLPPYSLRADAGDGCVELTWSRSVDENVGGYYIFYGSRPGEYLGREAVQGGSPIRLNNINYIKIDGLKNGKIYYFAVASYSRDDDKNMGELSKEVFARPLKKK